MVIEVCIIVVSLRGSILNTAPRSSMQYLLYIRLGTTANPLAPLTHLKLSFLRLIQF